MGIFTFGIKDLRSYNEMAAKKPEDQVLNGLVVQMSQIGMRALVNDQARVLKCSRKIWSQLNNIIEILEIESTEFVEVLEEQLKQRQQFEEMEKYNDANTQSKSDPKKIYTVLHVVNLRTRMDLPLSEIFFRNISQIAVSIPSMDTFFDK
jgi:hypothetical protein